MKWLYEEELKTVLTGKNEGYIFCGEASDGELAYPMIIKKTGYSDYRYPYAVHGWTGTL